MNLLIGSRAIAYHDPSFSLKKDADWDVVSPHPIEGTEHHRLDFLNNADIEQFATDNVIKFNGSELRVVSMKGLALIKRSHLWRDLGFQKHITHYHKFLKHHAIEITEKDKDFLDVRMELSRREFSQHIISLKKSKDEFFDDAVVKVFDHDYIHTLVAFTEKPMYVRMLEDGEQVFCSKEKWEKFTVEEKNFCVAEEAYTIAIERFMVPKDWKYPSKMAFMKSLDKVCTTLCSGWFRDWAIDHYPEVLSLHSETKFSGIKEVLT